MSAISDVLRNQEATILPEWIRELAGSTRRSDLMSDADLRTQATDLLRQITAAAQSGGTDRIEGPEWRPVRELLADISASRAQQGFSPSETATFIFSLKRPLVEALRKEVKDPSALFQEVWNSSMMIDKLGLYTTDAFIKSRDQIIARQQEEMMELSTPVVMLWDGIVALPLIGTLDSARTQVVMESLLQEIVRTNSRTAIIDITGVPTVDTLVAQHLLKTITAARLMGAECIISGIRPQIAQTIVHLGINLSDITTKAKLADAFAVALQRSGRHVTRNNGDRKSTLKAPTAKEE
jgi:rsbT co-antagonist protein RsbR